MKINLNHKTKIILLVSLLAVLACAIIGALTGSDPTIPSGISIAGMMTLGSVSDVPDSETSGSNLAYEAYLISTSQIDRSKPFPSPNSNREIGNIPMLLGQYMQYFQAHDIPTFSSTGEKGDITSTGENIFSIIMGGMRKVLLNFAEQHTGDKFVILFREVGATEWNILGSTDRPMVLQSFEAKNDKDGRYITFTFKRSSLKQYYTYVGAIVKMPAATHTADQSTLNIIPGQNLYSLPEGSSTYAITGVSGLTASDKGRYITLEGTGSAHPATIGDGANFVLEDGATWTAKAGSAITFLIIDATTLVEVQNTRIQTA